MHTGLRLADYAGRNVLAVGAHPDDLEIAVGGTLARLSKAGAKVHLAVVCVPTNLEKRKREAEKAAEIMGAESVEILYDDKPMRVEDIKTYELVAHMDDLIRKLEPAAVLSHAPSNFHKDHVLVHNACLASQRLAFFDFLCFYPTSCHPVQVAFLPQALVDISDTFRTKMDAIDVHESMFSCRGLTTSHYEDVARHFGRLAGVEYAEGLEIQRCILA